MPSEQSSDVKFEIGHVLFIDIVGYSKLLIDEQKEHLRRLTDIVLETAQVAKSANEKLVRVPAGDGMALVFRDSSEEPACCAVQVAQALRAHREIAVHMGIHSGPVSEVTDVNGRTNIAGAGINMAQRVMDCGDAGHILLSRRVAEDLAQYRQWSSHLHDLGECEVKHGMRLHLTSFYNEEVGNSALPAKLKQANEQKPSRPDATDSRKRRRRLIAMLLVGPVLLVAATSWWLIRRRSAVSSSNLTSGHISSLAVLPFKNYSGEPNQEYFADGMADLLTTELSGIGALTVKSHQSALKFKGSTKSMPVIGQELHADAIVEGSVLRDGNQVTVNVQLIDASTDRHLWAKKFDADVADIFKLRNQVVEETTISPEQSSRLSSARTVNPEALQEYLLGRQAWNHQTEKAFDEALQHLNRAKEIDPGFALAWAGMADVYWASSDAQIAPAQAMARAKAAAQRALELDDSLAEAHTALAAMEYSTEYAWTESEKEFQRSIQLKPNYALAHWQYGWLLIFVGRAEEALKEMERAVELDPLSAVMTTDLNVPHQLRAWKSTGAEARTEYDKAIAQCRKALELDPAFYLPHFVLGTIEMRAPETYSKAIEEFRVAQSMETQPIITAFLGYTYAKSGQRNKALETLKELDRLGEHRFVTPFCQALVHLGLGENDQAIDWLEKSYEGRSVWVAWFKVGPMYDSLRSDPRFQALYKKLNFPP